MRVTLKKACLCWQCVKNQSRYYSLTPTQFPIFLQEQDLVSLSFSSPHTFYLRSSLCENSDDQSKHKIHSCVSDSIRRISALFGWSRGSSARRYCGSAPSLAWHNDSRSRFGGVESWEGSDRRKRRAGRDGTGRVIAAEASLRAGYEPRSESAQRSRA